MRSAYEEALDTESNIFSLLGPAAMCRRRDHPNNCTEDQPGEPEDATVERQTSKFSAEPIVWIASEVRRLMACTDRTPLGENR